MRIDIDKVNPDYESCGDCIYFDAEESVCVQMLCIHAIHGLKERYVPKESVRRTGEWKSKHIITPTGGLHHFYECECGAVAIEKTKYCAECGRRMTE